jgi:site-specific recombinase XerD
MPDYVMGYYYYLNEKTYMTKKVYINNLIRFLEWYGNGDTNVSIEMLNQINPMTVQRYISSIQFLDGDKELSDDAKANVYSTLNAFLTYLKNNDLIKDNPFDGKRISRPKAHDNEITFLEPEEYSIIKRNIMSGVGNDLSIAKQKKWIYRDLLLFQIPIITGVRVTALSQISISDINFERGYILGLFEDGKV